MRTFTYLLVSLLLTTLINSCSSVNTEANKEAVLKIKGMTCQMGCANTIQARLQKIVGVSFAEVDFENETATVRFNSSVTDIKEIKATVSTLADGAYKVTSFGVKDLSKTSSSRSNSGGRSETSFNTESMPLFNLSTIFEKLIFFVK
ncbi:MAG: heavy-metal-associated domain-containing protein [Flavobacteriales bacterium]